MPSSHILQFVGGLAFFFYGLHSMVQVLQTYGGDRLKSMITRSTQSRFRSFITGMVAAFFFQSSSAVTVMMVGLTSSGLLVLEQAMAVALGAGIGTTFVVFLISIKSVVQSGMLIIVVGLAIRFLSPRKVHQIFGEILMGLGFIFFGMTIMSGAVEPLHSYPFIPEIFHFLELYPLTNLVLAAFITAFVHSSGVILGILISLAFSGSISFAEAMPLIIGANVGTSFTAVLMAWKGRTEGKRAAWANLLLRTGAGLAVIPFLPDFTTLMHQINSWIFWLLFQEEVSLPSEIALAHFFFNVLVALVFLPLLPWGKKAVCWLVPAKEGENEEFGPKYLDPNALATPTLAFAQVTRELVRMGEIVQKMFRDIHDLFQRYNMDVMEGIQSDDHKVDRLYKAIKFYLARLSFQNLKESEANTSIHLMTAVNELESIGDTIDRQMVRLAQKKWNKGVNFSAEGWQEIVELHQITTEMMNLALAALSTSSEELFRKMEHHYVVYTDREYKLTRSHLIRLNQGKKESIETSSVHLELLSLFRHVNESLLTMVNHLKSDQPMGDWEFSVREGIH